MSESTQPTPHFRLELVAQSADIDVVGHVSNITYVRWVQEVAIAHSSAVGLDWDAYVASGSMFVVRRHDIEYLISALEGDRIEIVTHVDEVRGASCQRRTRIARVRDGALLARATTLWAYVSRSTGRPGRIPPGVVAKFTRGV